MCSERGSIDLVLDRFLESGGSYDSGVDSGLLMGQPGAGSDLADILGDDLAVVGCTSEPPGGCSTSGAPMRCPPLSGKHEVRDLACKQASSGLGGSSQISAQGAGACGSALVCSPFVSRCFDPTVLKVRGAVPLGARLSCLRREVDAWTPTVLQVRVAVLLSLPVGVPLWEGRPAIVGSLWVAASPWPSAE